MEETLEALQQAFRDRLIAFLRERFSHMLKEQRAITRETRGLDLKLKALRLATAAGAEAESDSDGRGIDVRDRQRSQRLSDREAELMVISEDVLDLLTEDGTTFVFPQIVGEIHSDLDNVKGLLARIQTGQLTQRVQKEIESAIVEILKALEDARKKPPPPNPNKGRNKKGGGGPPLLAKSQELKMVRTLQLRVNKRTSDFDLRRQEDSTDLSPEKKLQVKEIARKQKEVEAILRRLAGPGRPVD